MVPPVRATPSQVAKVQRPDSPENQGSYPAEIQPEHLEWLQERAAQRRREWAEHTQSVDCTPKS